MQLENRLYVIFIPLNEEQREFTHGGKERAIEFMRSRGYVVDDELITIQDSLAILEQGIRLSKLSDKISGHLLKPVVYILTDKLLVPSDMDYLETYQPQWKPVNVE